MQKINLINIVGVLLILLVVTTAAAAEERMAVRVNIANVRSGPNLNDKVLWQVEKFFPIVVVEKKDEWRKIKDFENDQGWMHISMLDSAPTIIVKSNRCNLRKGPGTNYDIALTVDKGVPFKVLQAKEQWLEVQHADGDRGWVFKPLVW